MAAELEMETLTEGNGEIAEVGKRVSVHYEGRLEDGTVFDGSRPRGQAFSFTIGAGQVIPGWEQGVAGMKVGETLRRAGVGDRAPSAMTSSIKHDAAEEVRPRGFSWFRRLTTIMTWPPIGGARAGYFM